MWKSVRYLSAAVALAITIGVLPDKAGAQAVYTSFDEFLGAVGAYGIDAYEDFDVDLVTGPLARSAGGFGYTAAIASVGHQDFFIMEDPFSVDRWLSEEYGGTGLIFSGFDSGVRGIGGNFFTTDFSGFVAGSIRVTAADVEGNTFAATLTPAGSGAFFGLLFDHTVAWLKLESDDLGPEEYGYSTANNLVLATAPGATEGVPVSEPAPLMLLAMGAGLLVAARRRA